MTVNSTVSPSVSIAANPGSTVCTGTTVTFTATPTNGGSSPSYQWKVNNGNVGTNSPTYVTNTLTNGNIVTCVMTSNAACIISSTATSNGISMSIGSTTPSSTAAATTLSLCNAKADTLSASCSVVGATVQWQKFNGSSWVNIPGVVNSTYIIPAGLAAGSHSYWAVFTMPTGCFTQVKDTSNILVINSTAVSTPPVTSITAQTFLVQQGVYKAIYTATPSTGQYDWYLKVNGVWVLQAHTSTGSWVHNPMGRADTVFAVYWPQGGCYTADSSLSNKLIVQNPNGFADPTGKELQAEIYPNPILNGHTFMVEGLPKGTLLKVMDMMGQTIGQYALHTDGKNTITIEADLAAGYYLVHFTDPQGNGGKGRILVQK
ncbi:MAG: T9SS type A sorting domain-containing protein [Bacteroidetes bacterium]|nr:T9SS type A sorting domain-containing protein [Bacteroidota bacterium]